MLRSFQTVVRLFPTPRAQLRCPFLRMRARPNLRRRGGRVRMLLLAGLFFCLFCHDAACDAWTGRVVAVPEGDLLVISRDGQDKKYRLFGVDCPERGQPYWDKAQGLVAFLTEDKVVDVTPLFLGVEGFEKVLVRIEGTRDYLNQQLVAYGMAWVKAAECNSRMCSDWKKLQKMARSRSVGLWADPRPIAPWDWRRVQWREIINGKEMRRGETP